jgi:hypothetical protein
MEAVLSLKNNPMRIPIPTPLVYGNLDALFRKFTPQQLSTPARAARQQPPANALFYVVPPRVCTYSPDAPPLRCLPSPPPAIFIPRPQSPPPDLPPCPQTPLLYPTPPLLPPHLLLDNQHSTHNAILAQPILLILVPLMCILPVLFVIHVLPPIRVVVSAPILILFIPGATPIY